MPGSSLPSQVRLDQLCASQPYTVWLVLGDSISEFNHCSEGHENYVFLLHHRLRIRFGKARFAVIDTAVGGRTLADELPLLQAKLARFAPDLTTAMFGMNDCVAGLDGLAAFQRRLDEFIAVFRAAQRPLVMLTQNPIDFACDIAMIQSRRAYPAYSRAIVDACQRQAVPLIDVCEAWQRGVLNVSNNEHFKLMHDGIHPNQHGHRYLADLIGGQLLPDERTP